MPELPEVETVRQGLAAVMTGARIEAVDLRRPDLRRPFPRHFARRLAGRAVTGMRRRAKYLLADLDDGNTLVMHLGMSGSFRIETAAGASRNTASTYHVHPRQAAHDHVVIRLSSGTTVVYNDPRRFGFMDLVATGGIDGQPYMSGLGAEPLGRGFGGPVLRRLLAGRLAPLKAALLDQRLIAGLGNIYACEALWRARLSPLRPAGSLTAAETTTLAAAIKAVLREAVAAGGSSLRDHARADGSLGEFQHRFAVYDRAGERCRHAGCGGTIARIVQAGRSTFHCPRCQR